VKTKLFIPIAIAAIVVFFAGCGTDPTPCFEYTSETIDNGGDLPLVGEKIEFTNCSKDADTYSWDFDDGETSTSANPKHTFAEAGTYTVTLTATNSTSSKTTSQEIEVQATITGTWDGSMLVSTETYIFSFDIEQSGSDLTGTFQFDDGSGLSNFGSSSEIDGQDVKITFTDPTYGMLFNFTGEVNDDFDEMDGTVTITLGSTLTGSWSASKNGKKSTININVKGLDDLLKQIKK
jgi:PKD repeat protein